MQDQNDSPLDLRIENKDRVKNNLNKIDIGYSKVEFNENVSSVYMVNIKDSVKSTSSCVNGNMESTTSFTTSNVSDPLLNDANTLLRKSELLEDNKTHIHNRSSQSAFGVNRLGGYLFYPDLNKKALKKKKTNKEKLPYAATAPEWRIWHESKSKEKEEEAQRIATKKIIKETKTKIKQELHENLKKITPEKKNVQKRLKELNLQIQKNKAEEKLLTIELRSKQFDGIETTLENKISKLKENIKHDLQLKKELLKTKEDFMQEEKKIKTSIYQHASHKAPLKPINK